jgi:hypothetical protein
VRWDARRTVDAACVGDADDRSGHLSGGRHHRTRIGHGHAIRAALDGRAGVGLSHCFERHDDADDRLAFRSAR